MIKYKYNEDTTIKELSKYVDETYSQHYSHGKYQATEFIIDAGFGEGFCLGNIMKYAQRYGKKDGKNKKDLFKIIHYAMMAIDTLAKEQQEEDNSEVTPTPLTYYYNQPQSSGAVPSFHYGPDGEPIYTINPDGV
jgi:hypothetical protein